MNDKTKVDWGDLQNFEQERVRAKAPRITITPLRAFHFSRVLESSGWLDPKLFDADEGQRARRIYLRLKYSPKNKAIVLEFGDKQVPGSFCASKWKNRPDYYSCTARTFFRRYPEIEPFFGKQYLPELRHDVPEVKSAIVIFLDRPIGIV